MPELDIPLLDGELWWGAAAADGTQMPLGGGRAYSRNLCEDASGNQAAPLLLSSRGRVLWYDDPIAIAYTGGALQIGYPKAKPTLENAGHTLRDAYKAASALYFPACGTRPPDEFFERPQYNTWIEMTHHQSQAGVMAYARGLVESGFPPAILMIDCGWAASFGEWVFNQRFPDPAGMLDTLHGMGFKVMLWICPYITADTVAFRETRRRGLLVRNVDGGVAIREWWDGYSALLDMTSPQAVSWLAEQCDRLAGDYGVDGFKLDGGDAQYYRDTDMTFANVSACGQSQAWAEFGLRYPYNEYRACWKCGGKPLVQRLRDKHHKWDRRGLAALIPDIINLGLLGSPYSCTDMIGGGDYLDMAPETFDSELYIRYAQCSALMPMMQFSLAPWRVLTPDELQLCLECLSTRQKHMPTIMALANSAAKTGEPIVKHMEYVFPGQGLGCVNSQFMLGDEILVAPVLEKGAETKQVHLPAGVWETAWGHEVRGGGTLEVPVTLSSLPIFYLKARG